MDDESKKQLDDAYKEDLFKAKEKIKQEEAKKLSDKGLVLGRKDYAAKLEANINKRIEKENPAKKLEDLHYGELGGKDQVERENQAWKQDQQKEQARIQKEQEEQKRKAEQILQQQREKIREQEKAKKQKELDQKKQKDDQIKADADQKKKQKENEVKQQFKTEYSRINQGKTAPIENAPTDANQMKEELDKQKKLAEEKRIEEQRNRMRQKFQEKSKSRENRKDNGKSI